MYKLFQMPTSLQHFRGKDLKYISSYSKGLAGSCKQIKGEDYSVIFKNWTEYFLPTNKNIKSRLEDWTYIKRKLLVLVKEHIVNAEHAEGTVGYYEKNLYVGEESMSLREQQIKSNERFLAKHFNVLEGVDGETPIYSNQAKAKFAEYYNYCIGIEQYARDMRFACLFISITVPGYMHPNPTNKNCTWDGTSAKQAHDHLKTKWKKFQTELSRKKNNIRMSDGDIFGVRSVEPHADGTPHWHCLIYSEPSTLKGIVTDLLKKHFGEAPEALFISFFPMDENDNSSPPSSYIVKHLPGIATFCDDIGEIEKIKRADAWRSALDIRGFQRFGKTASISLWRLFRKFQRKWYSGELLALRERDNKRVLRNSFFQIAHLVDDAIFFANDDSKKCPEDTRRRFTRFVYAVKKIENMGHKIEIKEEVTNKYGELYTKVSGIDLGNSKYIFKDQCWEA